VVTVPSLTGLYEDIHQRAPQAEIRVLLYPHLFQASPPASCTVGRYFIAPYTIDKLEMQKINEVTDSLDAIISNAIITAQGQGIDIKPVSAQSDFTSHEVCSAAPWIKGLVLNGTTPSPFSFHPNAQGRADFAKLFEASL
jgi:hypothetical protein